MKVSKIDIANTAFAHLGVEPVMSTTFEANASRQVRLFNQFYELARKSVLRSVKWSFATATINLASLEGETSEEYEFCYKYPEDCLFPLRLVKVRDGKPLEYEVKTSADGNSKVLWSNVDAAKLEYTRDVENTTLFDASFVEALCYKLAALMCAPLLSDVSRTQYLEQKFQQSLLIAQAQTQNESEVEPVEFNRFLNARD